MKKKESRNRLTEDDWSEYERIFSRKLRDG